MPDSSGWVTVQSVSAMVAALAAVGAVGLAVREAAAARKDQHRRDTIDQLRLLASALGDLAETAEFRKNGPHVPSYGTIARRHAAVKERLMSVAGLSLPLARAIVDKEPDDVEREEAFAAQDEVLRELEQFTATPSRRGSRWRLHRRGA